MASSRYTKALTSAHLGAVLVFFFSLSMLPPAFVGLYFHEESVWAFLGTFILAGTVGLAGIGLTRGRKSTLKHRDGFLVLVTFWILLSLIGALPFVASQELSLGLTNALFEAISGITTTGGSILTDIDGAPKAFLYYRAQLNFLGGLGIIVLAVAILPITGIGGAQLYQSEVPGPSKDEKITPRLADTARRLWLIYALLAVACCLSYGLAGMGWFDALCHSLSTVSLGGFSTHGASLGYYDNAAIEVVGGVFSILAAVNFALYFAAFQHRNLKPLLANPEVRFFLFILTVVVGFTCSYLYTTDTFFVGKALHHGFFQSVSVMTGNGLSTHHYPQWPVPIALVLILSSFFGGCVGSTCGGLKAMRCLMLYKQSIAQIDQSIHPRAILRVKLGGKVVEPHIMQSVWAFFFAYISITIMFVVGLVLAGEDILTAFGTTAASINNMGIGYGATAGGFDVLTDPGKWLMCLAMLFGRLEIFPILILMSRKTWSY